MPNRRTARSFISGMVFAARPEARGGKGDRTLMGGAGNIQRFRHLKEEVARRGLQQNDHRRGLGAL